LPYFQGFSNCDYKIRESIACETAEPSINFSGLLYCGIGGLLCRGISGLAWDGMGGIVCAEFPSQQRPVFFSSIGGWFLHNQIKKGDSASGF